MSDNIPIEPSLMDQVGPEDHHEEQQHHEEHEELEHHHHHHHLVMDEDEIESNRLMAEQTAKAALDAVTVATNVGTGNIQHHQDDIQTGSGDLADYGQHQQQQQEDQSGQLDPTMVEEGGPAGPEKFRCTVQEFDDWFQTISTAVAWRLDKRRDYVTGQGLASAFKRERGKKAKLAAAAAQAQAQAAAEAAVQQQQEDHHLQPEHQEQAHHHVTTNEDHDLQVQEHEDDLPVGLAEHIARTAQLGIQGPPDPDEPHHHHLHHHEEARADDVMIEPSLQHEGLSIEQQQQQQQHEPEPEHAEHVEQDQHHQQQEESHEQAPSPQQQQHQQQPEEHQHEMPVASTSTEQPKQEDEQPQQQEVPFVQRLRRAPRHKYQYVEYWQCECAGQPRRVVNQSERKRKGSRVKKTNCQAKFVKRKLEDADMFDVEYFWQHNHPTNETFQA